MFFKIIFSCLLCLITSLSASKECKIAIGSIFQNEAPYFKEWIEHHKKIGVSKFFLYNNGSTDDYLSVLKPYIASGLVEVIQWPSVVEKNEWFNHCFKTQTSANNDAIKRAKKHYKWIALIDLDEYIVPVAENTLIDLMENHYSDVAALCINWQMYGTSGITLKEGELITKTLLLKAPTDYGMNRLCKTIVRPTKVKSCQNPHFCYLKDSYVTVDTHYKPCEGNTDVHIDMARINHYWAKDEYFLHQIKIPRYEKWGTSAESLLNTVSEMNEVYDDIMLRF